MSQRGRSARTRPQRLARRRASIEGIDRSGNRGSWYTSRWVLGTFGIIAAAALIVGLVVVGGNETQRSTADPPPIRRTGSEVVTGAVEGKPTWPTPPAFDLRADHEYAAEIVLADGETISIDLFETHAPQHVNNFVFLARQGFYDGLTFHEVWPGLRVRAGDPAADGSGGAGYILPDEPLTEENEAVLQRAGVGVVSVWRDEAGASSSQFVISLSEDAVQADGSTAFGQVTDGIEHLHALESRDPGAIPAPVSGARIQSIRITQVSSLVPDLSLSWSEPPEMVLEDGIDYRATIEMVGGETIEIDLYEDLSPRHVNNFVFLARQGFYDAVTFHRIIPGFVAQAGDPSGDGFGGPGYTIEAEFNDTRHVRGIASMARTDDPDSAGSQFFIVYDDAPNLDGQYTVFGEVIAGMDVVDRFPERDPQTDPDAPPGPQIAAITIGEIVRTE